MRHRHVKRRVVLSAAVAAVSGCGFGVPWVQAATDNWQGGSATAPFWDQAANWDLGAKPGTGDDAVFPSTIPATPGATISLGAGETANSLTFNGAYTLGSAAGSGDLTLTTGNVTVATGVTASIASQLKGTAGLTLNGGGTLNLTNTTTATTNNNFTGGVNINAGTLAFGVEAELGSATTNNITLNGGTLSYTGTGGSITFATTRIVNVGAGGGTIALTNTGNYSSTSGKINLSAAGQLTGSGPLTMTGSSDLQLAANNSTFSGAFTISGLVEASASQSLGTGSVTLTQGADLAVGTSANIANAITVTANTSVTGTKDPVISSIGGGGAIISGAVAVNGPLTVALQNFNGGTVPNNLTITGVLSGTGNITTLAPTGSPATGGATLLLNNAGNTYSGTISVAAGTGLSFGTATSSGGAPVVIASSTTALGGYGVGYDPGSQANLPGINTDNTAGNGGVFEINTATFATALDENVLYTPGGGSKWFIGSATAGTYSAATLGAPSDGNYRLGGGGGTLTVSATPLTGANNLIVNDPRTNGGGTVVLGSTAQTFTGTVTVNNGTLSIASVANGGTASPLGAGTSAVTLGSATTNGGLTFTGAANASTNRGITVGAGGGTVNVSTAAATLTVGPLSGTGVLTKSGSGGLTLNGPANTAGGATVSAGTLNANGATNTLGAVNLAAGTVLNLNGTTSNTGTTLTLNGSAAAPFATLNANGPTTFSGATTITTTSTTGANALINGTATNTVTFNGAFTIGTATTSETLTLGANTAFVMNASGSNFVVGTHSTANANLVNDTFDASAARSVSITAATVQVGANGGAPENTNTTEPLVKVILPTGATTTSSITASTALNIGHGENTGNNTLSTTSFTLDGGTTTITTPSISLGGQKRGTNFQFPAASSGSLTVSAAGGGKTNLVIGTNQAGATGTIPLTTMDLTTTATVNATLGNVTMATANISGTSAGGAAATFNLAASGPGSLVTADTVTLGTLTGTTTGATSFTTTFNVSAGTFRFNSTGTGFVAGTLAGTLGSRTTNINVSGTGLLDMNGLALNAVSGGTGTSTLSLTGGTLANASTIGNFTNLNFTGGTLLNPGTVGRALTQNGNSSLLDLLANNATISGNYTLTAGTALASVNRTLNVTGGATVAAAGVYAPALDASGNSGVLNVTNALDLSATGDTLNVLPQQNITTATPYTIALFASETGVFDNVLVNGAATQNTNPNGANYVLVTYNPTNIQLTVNNLSAVPEPASAALLALASAGLLARRRRRPR